MFPNAIHGKNLNNTKVKIINIFFLFLLQYGRQNIEKVARKKKTFYVEGVDGEDDLSSSNRSNKDFEIFEKSNKTYKNGSVGNTVIARSKDLIMVPEPDMHKDVDISNTSQERDSSHLSTTKEVFKLITRKLSMFPQHA